MRGMTVRRKILWLLTTGLVIVGVSAAAFAGAGKTGNDFAAALFARLDADADGIVTSGEVSARRGLRFDRFDSNGDGTVTRAEVERVLATRLDRIFKRLDANRDGAVSRAEYDTGVMGRFARFDENSDGRVTQIEFDKTRQDWQALRARMRQMGRDFWSEPAKP